MYMKLEVYCNMHLYVQNQCIKGDAQYWVRGRFRKESILAGKMKTNMTLDA